MPVNTIEWENGYIRLIDQTKLPLEFVCINCNDIETLWDAIKKLKVRGAPAIGIAAALGIAMAAEQSIADNYDDFKTEIKKTTDYLRTSRPTAVNLFWAIERMEKVVEQGKNKTVKELKEDLLKEALKVINEDKEICRRMGEYGASLVEEGDSILTHCNAGGLATADYGTALGVIYKAVEQGKKIKVYADETRPLLQGARLTVWELMQSNVDVTLICDNMAADAMKRGMISKIFVGADRVAANGDAANKIGTYSLAVLAKYHNIPFYIVAPVSTFDFSIKSGANIPIEQRDKQEIICGMGKQIAPDNAKVWNPAFDVTPIELITGIVTEKGIVKTKKEIESL